MKIKNTFEKNFLNKKNILVTGASRGIGKELALTLSSYGANIILHGRDEQALDMVYDEIIDTTETSPLIIQCDLNDLDENKSQNIANVISENVNILDGIIHNAAIIGKMSSIHDFDLKTWNKVINTNLTSTYLLTKFLDAFLVRAFCNYGDVFHLRLGCPVTQNQTQCIRNRSIDIECRDRQSSRWISCSPWRWDSVGSTPWPGSCRKSN